MKKLHLGCGKDIKPGYINVDCVLFEGVDLALDLNQLPYPFKDDEFDVIELHHVLEHLHNEIQVLEELYRIAKPDGKVIISVPYGAEWLGHIDHKRGYNYATFKSLVDNKYRTNYFSKANLKQVKMTSKPTGIGRIIPNIPVPFCQLKSREIVSTFLNNIVKEFTVELIAVKK